MKSLISRFRSKYKMRWLILCCVLVIMLIVGSFFLIRNALDPYDNRILDNVTIGGLDVGGMTRTEARKALKAAAKEVLLEQNLTVQLPQETFSLSPADAGIRLAVGKAVKAAYQHGRTGTEEARKSAPDTPKDIALTPYLTYDEAHIRSRLEAYAAQYNTQLSQAHWELQGEMPQLQTDRYDEAVPCQTLLLTLGTPKTQLDVEAAYRQILEVYDRAFAASQEDTYRAVVEVVPEEIPQVPDLEAIYDQYCVTPADDSLNMETYQFIPGSYGYRFDLENARALASAADWSETVSIPMEYVEPEILGDAVYFRDVLGTCETRHTNDENRNTNLRLLCAALDGVILQPGEEFSYNDTVGERTEEKGYKPATAYSGNRIVKDIGGGVCQGSTTLYNCALLADLEITDRVCHGAKVGYVTLGLDAAVNWNTKTDLKFRNNFHFPMMIRAEVSDGYVKMKILGTDEKDYYIEMRCGIGEEGTLTRAVSYKYKYSKETGELISKDRETFSTYYELD